METISAAPILTNRGSRSAPSKEYETASAFGYEVKLSEYDIQCAVVPSCQSACYRFTFPKSEGANILIDVARKVGSGDAIRDGSLEIAPAT